jgi:3D (Asp-Asp-Asp) domain-containing protein
LKLSPWRRNAPTLATTLKLNFGPVKLTLSTLTSGKPITPPPPSMKLFLLLTLALALTTPAHAPKLRRFTVSAYCHCRVCTHRGDGITASGVRVREGTTIAAPRSIPFGTRIWVPGAGWRTVQDRLSRRYDHRLDLYFTSHKRALQWGIKTLTCTVQ